MRLIVDVDDVVADTSKALLEGLHLTSGIERKPEDITAWDVRECLGISEYEEDMAWNYVAADPLPEIPGAVDAVRRLMNKHEVIFVTAPHRFVVEWTYNREQWLEERFPGARVVHTRHKELIPGAVIIDDKPENIIQWRAKHYGLGILFAQPWNATAIGRDLGTDICRVGDWVVIEKLLGSVEKRTESTRIAELRCP